MNPRHSRSFAALFAAVLAAALVSCGPSASEESSSTVTGEGSTRMFTVTSSAFTDGARIPDEYASTRAGGENRSLPLTWTGAPRGTQSFAVAVVDHAPVAHMWVHWAVVDISSGATSLPYAASGTAKMPQGAREVRNTAGANGYGGPAPPPGSGDHPYVVTVYALSTPKVGVPEQPTAADIEKAVAGKVLDTAEITGLYSR